MRSRPTASAAPASSRCAEIAEEYAIRGMRSVTLSLRDTAESEAFMTDLGFAATGRDRRYARFEIGAGGPAHTIDFLHEPDVPAGSWTYAAGTVHHIALRETKS